MKNYNKIYENIEPSTDLIVKTIEKSTKTLKYTNYKPLVAVASLVLIFTIPVVASQIDRIYQMMSLVSIEEAEDFILIEKENTEDLLFEENNEEFIPTNEPIFIENDDMHLEVISIKIDENIAKLYITLKDLRGNRVNDSISLSSFSIDGLKTASLGSEMLGFDKETKKAIFMITITDFENILDTITEKITFSIHEFSTSNLYWDENEDLNIDISEIISQKTDTKEVNLVGASGYYRENTGKEVFSQKATVLEENISPVNIGIEDINIVACAFIDGKLHIQTKKQIINEYNESYSSMFLQKNGENIDCLYAMSFTDNLYKFAEYVFDVDIENISNYELKSIGMSSGQKIISELEVSFNLLEYN